MTQLGLIRRNPFVALTFLNTQRFNRSESPRSKVKRRKKMRREVNPLLPLQVETSKHPGPLQNIFRRKVVNKILKRLICGLDEVGYYLTCKHFHSIRYGFIFYFLLSSLIRRVGRWNSTRAGSTIVAARMSFDIFLLLHFQFFSVPFKLNDSSYRLRT